MHYKRWQKTGDPLGKAAEPKPTCGAPRCGKKHFANGWCNMHHKRWLRNGDALSPQEKEWAKRDLVKEHLPAMVAKLTGQGASADQIGKMLGVSERTVVRYRTRARTEEESR